MASAMVIDDNTQELQYSLTVLKNTGRFETVQGFSSPKEACQIIREKGVDVLFLEIEMKGVNCFSLIETIKKIRQDIFYVIMTSDDNYAYEAFQKGVMHYVLKPLSAESITKTFNKLKRVCNF